MSKNAMQIDAESPFHGASPWAYAVRYQFTQSKRKRLARLPLKGMSLELQQGAQSLWIVAKWPSGGGLVIRTSFSPEEGLQVEQCNQDGRSVECLCTSPSGTYRLVLEIREPEKPVMHFTVALTPEGKLSIPFWPSDAYPIDQSGDPMSTKGLVHAAQRGPAMGFVYASLLEPRSGSFLYFQNLTSLNDLCAQTEAVPETRVGGSWPELGYTPPIAERRPLEPGTEVVISDGYVRFSPEVPDNTGRLAELFFDMLADIYLQIPRPEAVYRDWISMAEDTVRDLDCEACTCRHHGLRYLNAYVGTSDRRPESLVQLAVALPLLEYADWRGREVPMIRDLKKTLPSFYYDSISCVMRYPCKMRQQDGADVDEKSAFEVDSWYLYHPLVNLARLVLMGHKDARDLLFKSLPYAMKVARHFDYKWPVLFDANTLEAMREATEPELGETDVAGLYAYLMLQMRELTGDDEYLQEAKTAADALMGLNFNVGYQFNNTAWAANALAKLWHITGDDTYLHLSSVCIASIMQNTFIWDCDYGYAKHYSTFMGITPLREGAYIAAYEETEIFAAFFEYLGLVDAHVAPSIHMLVCEFCKFATDNLMCLFPGKLPADIIADSPRNGHIDSGIAIPLEDIYQGWTKPGQVGQEVYGAGMAPAIVARCYHHLDKSDLILYCQYPVQGLETGSHCCTFRLYGNPRLKCLVRLISTRDTLRGVKAHCRDGDYAPVERVVGGHYAEFEVPGGCQVELRWK